MRHMSKILDLDTEQLGKEVFLSLAGNTAERINDISTDDMCNPEKVLKKLDKTFLLKKYHRAVLEEFCSMMFKTDNKLSEFYEDLKVAYSKARPRAVKEIMQEDITS